MKNLPHTFSRLLFLFFALILFSQCSRESEDEITAVEPDTVEPPNQNTPNTNNSSINTSHLSPITIEPMNRCEDGRAGDYPCAGYDLYAFMSLSDLSASFINDIWGWTDEETNKEYVVLGLKDGTAFIDISNPKEPKLLGKLPTRYEESYWRDVKVYNNHAFIVSEADNHGLQVFDLTRLRGVTEAQQFTADAHLDVFRSAHNIVINESSGYAYVVGATAFIDGQSYNGATLFIDIRNPKNPQFVGSYGTNRYIHDAQVVQYNGPDTDYSGREILFGSSSDGRSYYDLVIVDVTNKSQPRTISTISYPSPSYTHQNWLTENQEYVLLGDETDESDYGFNTRTLIFDVKNLDAPQHYFSYDGTTVAIDHNGYVRGNSYFLSNYTAGLREIDITNIANKQMQEIAYFDTSPQFTNATFYGVWSIYPYFESGFIPISDSDNGLFLVRRSL